MRISPLVNDLRPQATQPNSGRRNLLKDICLSLILLGALWSLTGCAGLSTGSSKQSPSGTISLANSSLTFGSVKAGSVKTASTTATNSGSAAVTISNVAISTKYFSLSAPALPVTLSAGQSVTLSVKFAPNAAGSFSGSLAISSTAADSVTNLDLSGTGTSDGQLTLSPASESFGNVTVGQTKSATLTLTNSGSGPVNVAQVSASGTGFQIAGISPPLTLNASDSTTFTVAFTPQAAEAVSGSVTVSSNASNSTLTLPVSGTGTNAAASSQLTVSPSTLGLGNVVVGSSGSASGSLTATGGSVTVTAATSNNSVFAIGGISLPVTIPAGQSIPFRITFSPLVSGGANATLTFSSNAQTSSIAETLTGNGTPAPTHSVSLNWNASTSGDITGYNIYRAVYSTSCGAFKKLNSSLNLTTLYTDSTVTDGVSYCYATTAVNSTNQESRYSNIASNVQIPAQ